MIHFLHSAGLLRVLCGRDVRFVVVLQVNSAALWVEEQGLDLNACTGNGEQKSPRPQRSPRVKGRRNKVV